MKIYNFDEVQDTNDARDICFYIVSKNYYTSRIGFDFDSMIEDIKQLAQINYGLLNKLLENKDNE
jgi:hypothetical protein